MNDVLIHTCCAPCYVSVMTHFEGEGLSTSALFYNPFIHPFKEYKARFNSMKKLEEQGIDVHYVDEYDLRGFVSTALSSEKRGENRCTHCYMTRLDVTAGYAKNKGFQRFATTLIVSPYQDIPLINRIGDDMGGKYGIEYMPLDLRHLHDEGHKKAREMDLYMQNYCGCIFSEEERFKKPLIKK